MKKIIKKKGFTLVELIVVIAILGVLAAIIIPTLLSYTVRSHVSNVNTTAAKMRDNVTYFLTQADVEGYGMFLSSNATTDLKITVSNSKWSIVTTNVNVFANHYDVKWNGNGTGWDGDGKGGSLNAEERLASYLAATFRELDSGYIELRLVGGACSVLYFTTDQEAPVTDIPPFGTLGGWSVESFSWDNRTQGVSPSGKVVGTSPVLPLSM